jgi:hypothetical protein
MGRGGARANAGRRPLPKSEHWLKGSWRVGRHGPRPPTLAAVVELPTPGAAAWTPSADDLAELGPAGRVFVEMIVGRFDVGLVEGRLLMEAGHAVSALADLRAGKRTDGEQQRLELAWSRHLAALVGQLRMERS